MENFKCKLKTTGMGFFLSIYCSVPVLADDTEIYTKLPGTITTKPNVLIILDNSGSMTIDVPSDSSDPYLKEQFDVTDSYPGGCFDSTKVYYSTNGTPPACGSPQYFNLTDLHCDHANDEYDSSGVQINTIGPIERWGTYADQMAQHGVTNVWGKIKANNGAVECAQDQGIHGSNIAPAINRYIDNSAGGWQSSSTTPSVWSGGDNNYTLFHGNYLNYLTDPNVPLRTSRPTRFEEVTRAITALIDTNTSINVGLMTFDADYNWPYEIGTERVDGGGVVFPVEDINTGRTGFKTALNALVPITGTPLSESYHEALQYFAGAPVRYGLTSGPLSVSTAQDGSGNYISPISNECQQNSIIVLTDGLPTHDNLNVTELSNTMLPGFVDTTGCAVDDITGVYDDSQCLDDLAAWALTNDVIADDGSPARDGVQNITTHTVGFAEPSLSDPGSLIVATAAAGGGQFVTADNADTLRNAISAIFAETLAVNTTFSSPAVSVNAFNRATHLEDLYFTLFKPGEGVHWDGNLKKYKLKFELDTADKDNDGDTTERLPFIADKTSTDAVPVHAIDDVTGFFSDNALSYWSIVDANGDPDGKQVGKGGAAGTFNTSRDIYTYTGSYTDTDGVFTPSNPTLNVSANTVELSNLSLSDSLLGITGYAPIVGSTPYRETLIKWAAGIDALGEFGTPNTYNDARLQMGDPLHAEPALVQYGGTVVNPDLVAFVATNDGYLHAFDADTGDEFFSFIPQELLSELSPVMENQGGNKKYGLDGSVVAWINDIDGNGIVDGTDHVYLYVSMRRGGRNIYALDVTNRTAPKLLWVIKGGAGKYAELGDTWSTINVEKVKDGSVEKTVLIFGGGYDDTQDSVSVTTADSVGRTVYIADAATGERLVSLGKDGPAPTTDMEYSIPARVKPLDISGDGYTDRLYVADMGGQIFRYDINNNNSAPLESSITGARIADLAGSGISGARRFYYPPDVAVIEEKGSRYHALIISSGYRAHPLNVDIHDRIYMIKDTDVGFTTSLTTNVTELNLHDATANLAGGDAGVGAAGDAIRNAELSTIQGAEGWFIKLDDENNSGSWLGEKGLAEPLIIEGVAIVTTYTPNTFVSTNSCEPNIGSGKVFFLDLLDATPAFPSNTDLRPQRHTQLKRGGIPPSPNVIITKGGVPTLCIGTECSAANFGLGIRKTYWYEVEK